MRDLVVPVGPTIVRYFDLRMNQYAHKTFYILYGQDLFGTSQFSTLAQFQAFLNNLFPQPIMLLLNGCNMIINGKQVNIL